MLAPAFSTKSINSISYRLDRVRALDRIKVYFFFLNVVVVGGGGYAEVAVRGYRIWWIYRSTSTSSFLLWKFVIGAAARLLSRYHSAKHKLNICQPMSYRLICCYRRRAWAINKRTRKSWAIKAERNKEVILKPRIGISHQANRSNDVYSFILIARLSLYNT
jgi:hypothetical protein